LERAQSIAPLQIIDSIENLPASCQQNRKSKIPNRKLHRLGTDEFDDLKI
jgi:hypothetical protein